MWAFRGRQGPCNAERQVYQGRALGPRLVCGWEARSREVPEVLMVPGSVWKSRSRPRPHCPPQSPACLVTEGALVQPHLPWSFAKRPKSLSHLEIGKTSLTVLHLTARPPPAHCPLEGPVESETKMPPGPLCTGSRQCGQGRGQERPSAER